MKLLFVTPECAPLTKTGGLGDVSAALPAALRALGIDVRTLLPAYSAVLERLPRTREIARLELFGHDLRLLEAGEFLLLDCAALYRREGGPYQDAAGVDWPDNGLRFGLLSRVCRRGHKVRDVRRTNRRARRVRSGRQRDRTIRSRNRFSGSVCGVVWR